MLSRMVSSDWARARWPGPTLTSLKNDSTCQKHYTIKCVYLPICKILGLNSSLVNPFSQSIFAREGDWTPFYKTTRTLGSLQYFQIFLLSVHIPPPHKHHDHLYNDISVIFFLFCLTGMQKNSTRDHMTGLLTSPRSNVEVKPEVTALIMAPIVKEPCPKSSVIWAQCCLTMCHAGSRPPGFLLISWITAGTSWGRILVGSSVYARNLR